MTIKYKFVTGEEVYVEVYGRLERDMIKLDYTSRVIGKMSAAERCVGLSKNFINSCSDPEVQLLEHVYKETLRKAVLQLRSEEQKLINNLYLTDKPITRKQYADVLGVNENSVELSLARVKKKLKHIMLSNL